MSHLEYLATSLENLYNGNPWIDVVFTDHLKRIDARVATQRFSESNCIWQIVNHIIYWNQHVLRYINNEQPEQDGDLPDFYLPENHGEENWQATQHRLQHSVAQMVAAMRSFPADKLDETIPGSEYTAGTYFHGVVEHAAYHLGQIVLLEKYSANHP